MTLLVVPRSIPATDARPRKPFLAMIPRIKMESPMREGIMAEIPPDLDSELLRFRRRRRRRRLLEEEESFGRKDVSEEVSLVAPSGFLSRFPR